MIKQKDTTLYDKSTTMNFWSVSLPRNGFYLLAVEIGNPCGLKPTAAAVAEEGAAADADADADADAAAGGGGGEGEATEVISFLKVNGLPLVEGLKIKKGQYYTVSSSDYSI